MSPRSPAIARPLAFIREGAAHGCLYTRAEVRRRYSLTHNAVDTLAYHMRAEGLRFQSTRAEVTGELRAHIIRLADDGARICEIAAAVARKDSTVAAILKAERERRERAVAERTEAAGQGERRESEAPPPAPNSMVRSFMAHGLSREEAERRAKWEMHKRVHGLRVTEPAW